MVLEITKFIAQQVKASNEYLGAFAINCIKTKDNKIVSFVGTEKRDFSISDIDGLGAYLRIDGKIEYEKSTRREHSCENRYIGRANIWLVIYNVNRDKRIDPFKIENKITGKLIGMPFWDYTGKEKDLTLVIKGSNLNTEEVYQQETGSLLEQTGATVQIMALNSALEWSFRKEDCVDNCEVYEDEMCSAI
jgi:hypothetical protein